MDHRALANLASLRDAPGIEWVTVRAQNRTCDIQVRRLGIGMAKEKKPTDGTPVKRARKTPAKKAAAASANAEQSASTVAAAAERPSQITTRPAPSAAELYDEVRRRAYELYQERGGQHGSHETDWHRAEIEVRAKYNK